MLKKIIALSLGCILTQTTLANIDTVKENIAQKYPNLHINHLSATEVKGLYSGQLDDEVVYINEDAEYLIFGAMMRLKDKRNLTNDLMVKQNTVDFKSLPLNDAIKTVKGNGKRVLAVFSDPNCPYCKTLDANLEQLDNVTIYTFMYPIKTQSVIPSKKVWCSPNKEYAWRNLIQKSQQATASSDCKNPIERNLKLGNQLGIQGTPAMIFSNGLKVTGAHSAENIEKIWKELGL